MKTLILDPGHGGKHIGAAGNGLIEKNVVLGLSLKIKDKLLNRYDVKVIMTREADKTVSLDERCKIANDAEADLFYSVHSNAFGDSSARGFESYIFNGGLLEKTSEIQTVCHKEVVEYLSKYNVMDRGMKRANFQVLRDTRMSAILTENLFITNPDDAKYLKDDAFLDGLAAAHAQGIAKAMKLQPKPIDDKDKLIADLEEKLIGLETEYAKLKARYDANVAEYRELLADIKRAAGILNKYLIE